MGFRISWHGVTASTFGIWEAGVWNKTIWANGVWV